MRIFRNEEKEIGQIGVSRNRRWGKLKEVPTSKADESILIQIADKDIVALEVKYHNVVMKSTHCSLDAACSQLERKMKPANTKSHLMFSVKTLLFKSLLNRIIYITLKR